MSGKEILVDTNIILYLLEGSDELQEYLQGKNIYLSFITELELIAYKGNSLNQENQIAELLADCSIIPMNNLIKSKYIEIRREFSLKLADAVIASTSLAFDMPLITADKQFKKIGGLRLISYQHSIKLTYNKEEPK